MKYEFVPMNEDYAGKMIDNWKYDGEYSVYDYSGEAEELLDKQNWGYSKFAALDEDGKLVGELTIEMFGEPKDDEDDGYIEYEAYKENPDAVTEMWIGFGLRPDLTGKGLGMEFVSSCIDFAASRYEYKGRYLRLAVSDFNKRARKTYERLGFKVYDTYEIAEENKTILWMRKELL